MKARDVWGLVAGLVARVRFELTTSKVMSLAGLPLPYRAMM